MDLKTIGDFLGHKSEAMAGRYAHLTKRHRERAVAVLEARNRNTSGKRDGEEDDDDR